jgi:predicted dehydrogenase
VAFRWGVLGTGPVSRNFLLGLRACAEPAAVTVVVSRNRSNAERFAAELGVAGVADDYQAAAVSPEVDALYIATPPSEHESHALAGISAGKPVLIEKPLAMDATAAARIIEAAREKRVFCMEAMWTRFLPLIGAVQARIAAGELGEIRAFRGDFLAANRPDIAVSLFDPARGGGALMHRGVYAVSLARLFLGPIEDVQSMASVGNTGVDEDCSLVLRHRSGALSTIRASLRTTGANDVTLHGTKGVIQLESPIYRPFAARSTPVHADTGEARDGGRLEQLRGSSLAQGLKQRADGLVRTLGRCGGTRFTGHFRGNGFHYEAEALMQAVATGALESEVMPLDESLEIMTVIDRARAAWQRGSAT